jgi:hypothetical protein
MTDTSRTPDSSHIENVAVAHEHRDVNVRAILAVAAGLVVVAIVVHVAVWVLFLYFQGRDAAAQPRAYPLASVQTQLPPAPRVQARPSEDLQDLRRQEEQTLSTYGWVDERAGIARIPIEQAMKLTIERGLPTRAPGDGQSGGRR